MRFKILMLSLFVSFSMAVNAQQPGRRRGGDPTQRAVMQTQMMVDSLSLSAKQAEKVKAININFAEKQKAARANSQEGNWEKMRVSMDSLRDAQNTEIKTVLTTEQYNHWHIIADRQFKNRGAGGQNPPAPPPAEEMDKKEKAKGRKDKSTLSPPPPPLPAP